jgi:amino acid permease
MDTYSFLDMGGALYGPWMRYLILGSIVVSQIGFVGAYTIFVAENLQVCLPDSFNDPNSLKKKVYRLSFLVQPTVSN